MFNANDVVLFQGDSITDAGRNKDQPKPNMPGALGNGYAYLTSAALLHQHAGKHLQIYNRGISGNKVGNLLARVQVLDPYFSDAHDGDLGQHACHVTGDGDPAIATGGVFGHELQPAR